MAISHSATGKKRAYDEARACSSSSSLSALPSDYEAPSPKKKKARPARAETRKCPVCDEEIPLRLLSKHAQLESERVEEVVRQVGSSDIDFEYLEESLRSRRSAFKARKSINTKKKADSSEEVGKVIQTIIRHRKQRHAKLKEMAKEEEEGYHAWDRQGQRNPTVCPVCSVTIQGDQMFLNGHVDSCLVNETRRLEEERERESSHRSVVEEEVWEGSQDDYGNGGHVGDIRGTGFHTRDRHTEDVDEEIDVDGDDQAVFGAAQFTEGDILPVDASEADFDENVEVEIEADGEDEAQREQKTLRDLVAEGKVIRKGDPDDDVAAVKAKMDEIMGIGDADKMELAILAARKRGEKNALILALENKVKQLEIMRVSSSTSLLCRICIDPYNEPTVSTGCWHTCCRECWLRCLGSTKLCPICKRITGASDLRRIYL